MKTKSDHKPVIANINIKWKYNKHQKPQQRKINYKLFHDPNYRNNCNDTVTRLLRESSEPSTNQDKWTNIVNITKKAAIETLGYIPKERKHQNQEIKELSEKQKKLHLDYNSINDSENARK
jgi:hypothetical protein